MATQRMRDFLLYVNDHSPVSLFPMEWSVMKRKAVAAGYIERAGVSDSTGFVNFQLTAAGLKAMRGEDQARA